MQIRFFMFKIVTIPFDRNKKGFDEENFNRLVLNKKIKCYRAEFFEDGGEKYWTVFLEYDSVIEKNSEKEIQELNENQRALLDHLKVWRKERAEKDAVPVYILSTNKELIDIVKKAPGSLEALKTVKGFGQSKVEKYGKEIIDIINGFYSKI